MCPPLTAAAARRAMLFALALLGAFAAAARFTARADTPPPAWAWRLSGVVTGPGLSQALFTQGGETRTVGLGARIDGWTLVAVRPHEVTLLRGEQAMTLSQDWVPPAEATAIMQERDRAARAASVDAALQQQQTDQAAAETALSDLTRSMLKTVGQGQ